MSIALLLSKIEAISKIKSLLTTDYYYEYQSVNSQTDTKGTITVVMTASNRSKQTHYTLKSFTNSNFKNIQVVLVDDSDTDPIYVEDLKRYPFWIDFIKINKSRKDWHNPCVNYNIGFLFVKGEKVIIQNAEVCHVGDVLDCVYQTVDLERYYAFDVKASLDYECNEVIYAKDRLDISTYEENIFNSFWFQHSIINNRKFHFLVAMSYNVFKTINGFSLDYAFGDSYDDDDLLLKISASNIPILSLNNSDVKCGGIHLFHGASSLFRPRHLIQNKDLYELKRDYLLKSSKYIEITEDRETIPTKLLALGLRKPVILTITGIRPDFIRMSLIFKELDANFNHILLHTGQHYDELLSDVFFKDLQIRKPDYILDTGKASTNHYEQLSYLATAVPRLLKEKNINPDLILFLGDSNSAAVSLPLKKEGYKIGHIEAGMRSYDKRMLEEINRTVCDHCSDILFVYHDDYKEQARKENITKNVFVVGNTIVEPLMMFKNEITTVKKRNDMILLDVHRPENFNYLQRLLTIFKFANQASEKYGLPVKMLYFKRLHDMIIKHSIDIGKIEMVPLMSYKKYLDTIYHCRFIISDSGTGQEEPALLGTPVIVPRDFTERPQSYLFNCSVQFKNNAFEVFQWIDDIENSRRVMNTEWLGNGQTSRRIVEHLKVFFL